MADYLKSILGDKLLSSPIGGEVDMTQLPSPEVISFSFFSVKAMEKIVRVLMYFFFFNPLELNLWITSGV